MVKIPTETVLMRLNSNTANQNAENASVTVIPKILPPNRYAKVGNTIKRLATSATSVAIKQETERLITTVFKFLLY